MRVQVAALLLLAMAGSARAVDPGCWVVDSQTPTYLRTWEPSRSIPVYVSEASIDGVQTAFFDPSKVETAANIAIQRWNEQSGTTLRLVWSGRTTIPPTSKSIVIKGNSSGCSNIHPGRGSCNTPLGSYCTQGIVRLDAEALPCNGTKKWATTYDANPEQLVDQITHQIGHVLGREDAHAGCVPNTCGSRHKTIMSCDLKQELTGFDRRDHQDVYGRKNIANVLKHRTMLATAMTWSGVFDNGSNGYDLIPGPGST
jgi:hypothetical protein